MSQIIAVIFTVLLSSCMRIGDGMFVVEGELSGLPSEENCVLIITPKGKEEISLWKAIEISGVFSNDFTVSPYPNQYKISVSCNGTQVTSKLVSYPKDMGVGGTVDLGRINVQW